MVRYYGGVYCSVIFSTQALKMLFFDSETFFDDRRAVVFDHAMQAALETPPHYIIEVISEKENSCL